MSEQKPESKRKKSSGSVDKRKGAHRGIIAEIAREQGVKPPAIWEAIEIYQNPRILELYTQKLNTRLAERESALENYNRAIERAKKTA